jgi:hypothetical protein
LASDEPAEARFKELLVEFERHIRDNADLDRLKLIRRQIRKALPLSVRAYLPAYLLREAVGAGVRLTPAARDRPVPAKRPPQPREAVPGARPAERPAVRPADKQSAAPPAATDSPAAAPAAEPDGDMARLFVSVGRSRRVSREMLADLFIAKLELPQEQIGEVRVLDNFSFIEVPTAVAQTAIDRITGETLNGRRVNVDFARSKKS